MPKPPTPRSKRASRKPLLYSYLRRWYEPGLGLDPFEWGNLEWLGYGRWLSRGRLTAEMTVALLLYTLDDLDYNAADRPIHQADLRGRIIEALQRRRMRPARGDQPAGLTKEERELGHALVQLEDAVNEHGGPQFIVGSDDSVKPASETGKVAAMWRAIQKRWPGLVTALSNEVVRQATTDEKLKLGSGRRDPVIHLGEQASYGAEAEQLRNELGERFLDPTASTRYRASRVRKWKQLALAESRQPS